MFGFVGDSTLRLAVEDVSPEGPCLPTTQVYCPASFDRKSVGKINISSLVNLIHPKTLKLSRLKDPENEYSTYMKEIDK